MVSVKQTYQYPDTQPGDEDAFSREPFVVWFQSPKTSEMFQKQIFLPLASLMEQDSAGWTRARGGGKRKGPHPDPTLHFLTRAAFAFGAAASGIACSSAHAAAPGKPLLLPQAVVWRMRSMLLAWPWEQLLPWVSEQGLPYPDTAPHRVAAQPWLGSWWGALCNYTAIASDPQPEQKLFLLQKNLLASKSVSVSL